MTHTLRAVYDGAIIRPEGKPDLPINIPFDLVYDEPRLVTGVAGEWLRTAMDLDIVGPPDGAERLHEYLAEARQRGERA